MTVEAYDPFVLEWTEIDVPLYQDLPSASGFDAVVFSTPHNMFREMDFGAWIGPSKPIVLDTVNVLAKSDRDWCRAQGVHVESIGRAKGL